MLVKDPFNLTPEEVGRLTPFQLRHVFFRPEGDSHQTHGQTTGPRQSPKDLIFKLFLESCLAQGKTEVEARQLWEADTQRREAQKEQRQAKLENERSRKKTEALARWQKRRQEDRLNQAR